LKGNIFWITTLIIPSLKPDAGKLEPVKFGAGWRSPVDTLFSYERQK
jgi:hypothetical protein